MKHQAKDDQDSSETDAPQALFHLGQHLYQNMYLLRNILYQLLSVFIQHICKTTQQFHIFEKFSNRDHIFTNLFAINSGYFFIIINNNMTS